MLCHFRNYRTTAFQQKKSHQNLSGGFREKCIWRKHYLLHSVESLHMIMSAYNWNWWNQQFEKVIFKKQPINWTPVVHWHGQINLINEGHMHKQQELQHDVCSLVIDSHTLLCVVTMANYTKIFRTHFLQNRSIDFDKTFFVKKLKLSSFRNGMACLWSLKLVMGSPSHPLSTTVTKMCLSF